MTNDTIEELRSENEWLRDLLVSLSATLLRRVALDPARRDRSVSKADAKYLLKEAEMCFRCARIPKLKIEIAQGLEVAGNELMAKAVEIETRLQREEREL